MAGILRMWSSGESFWVPGSQPLACGKLASFSTSASCTGERCGLWLPPRRVYRSCTREDGSPLRPKLRWTPDPGPLEGYFLGDDSETQEAVMSWLWYYWPGLLTSIAFLWFAVPEAYAIITGKGPTFSYFMASVRKSSFGPIWCWLWGVLCGGLVVHFSTWCMYTVQ